MRNLRASFHSLLFTGLIGLGLCTATGAGAAQALSESYQRAERMLFALAAHRRWMTMALNGATKDGAEKEQAVADHLSELNDLQKEIAKIERELQSFHQRGERVSHLEVQLAALLLARHQWQCTLHRVETDLALIKQIKAKIQILENQLLQAISAVELERDDPSHESSSVTFRRLEQLMSEGQTLLFEVKTLLTHPA